MKGMCVPPWAAETHALVWNLPKDRSVSMVSVVRMIVFVSVARTVSGADPMAVSPTPAPTKNAEGTVSVAMESVYSAVLKSHALLLRPVSMVYVSRQAVRIIWAAQKPVRSA